jgi:catalase
MEHYYSHKRQSTLRSRLLLAPKGFVLALLLAGFALPVVAQSNPDLAQQILDTMLQVPGNKPGFRTVHAKGIVCQGTFTGSKDAAGLSRAEHFRGGTVPVTIRFSDAAPSPEVADVSPDTQPRGMAIRFELPGNKETDIVAFSHNGFVVGNGDEFLALQKAVVATDPTKAHPWPVEVFLSARPRSLKFVQDPKPTPVSFATEAFFGNNAFVFINAKGIRQAGRYQIVPVAGQHYITDADAKTKSQNFLLDELKAHLAKEPAKFRLLVQLPNAGDPTNDASIVWGDDRKTVELGTITVSSVVVDNDPAQKSIDFDPVRLTDGIELSDDPLPALRSSVYALARMYRRSH